MMDEQNWIQGVLEHDSGKNEDEDEDEGEGEGEGGR